MNAHDLERFGPLLENHPIFPERANISLAAGETSRNGLKLRTCGAGRRSHASLRHCGLCALRRCSPKGA